jgi:hypothetical protein
VAGVPGAAALLRAGRARDVLPRHARARRAASRPATQAPIPRARARARARAAETRAAQCAAGRGGALRRGGAGSAGAEHTLHPMRARGQASASLDPGGLLYVRAGAVRVVCGGQTLAVAEEGALIGAAECVLGLRAGRLSAEPLPDADAPARVLSLPGAAVAGAPAAQPALGALLFHALCVDLARESHELLAHTFPGAWTTPHAASRGAPAGKGAVA